MAEVKILIEGYTTVEGTETAEEKTCPTITLVRDKDREQKKDFRNG